MTLEEFRASLPHLIHEYVDRGIFNADKKMLFCKQLPDRRFIFKMDTCSGARIWRERERGNCGTIMWGYNWNEAVADSC